MECSLWFCYFVAVLDNLPHWCRYINNSFHFIILHVPHNNNNNNLFTLLSINIIVTFYLDFVCDHEH